MSDSRRGEASDAAMRGVERTLTVLRSLNEHDGGASVTSLSSDTQISRPALYRILETLAFHGYVRRRPDDDRYELTSRVRLLSDGYKEDDWVREAALPLIEELQREIVWPTDLATFSDNAMYLRETTRRISPLTIDGLAVGVRLPMLHSATGRAFLAFCDETERNAIIENLRRSARPEDLRSRDARHVQAMITATRRRGYGEREEEIYPKTSAIAVPVYCAGRMLACLNITFIASVLKPKAAAERYLEHLRRSAEEIGRRATGVQSSYGARQNAGRNRTQPTPR